MAAGNPSYVKVNRGAIPSWSDFNALVDLVNRQRLRQGVGYLIHESTGGTTLRINGGNNAASTPHAYTASNASVGATPMVAITPGTTNGVVPTIDGNPINVKTGTPPAYPLLTLGNSDTRIYFQIDYNTSSSPTTIELMSCDESGWTTLMAAVNIVPGTGGSDYKLLTTLVITFDPDSGKASIKVNNDAVSGPQNYSQCGTVSNSSLA